MAAPMQPSRNGTLFVGAREALVLAAYPDPDPAHLSVYFGHNGSPEQIAAIMGTVPTIAQGFGVLKQDLSIRAADLNRWLKVPVTQSQFDALLSCYFEYGTKDGSFAAIIDAVNYKVPLTVGNAFLNCCKDKAGTVVIGLLYRRIEELLLYFTGNYGNIGTVQLWRGDPKTTKSEVYTVQVGDI